MLNYPIARLFVGLKFVVIAVMMFAVTAVLPSPTPARAQDPDPCYVKGGWIDEETGRCVIRAGIEIDLAYPTEIVGYPFIEAEVDAFMVAQSQEITAFFSEIDPIMIGGFNAPWSLYINYEIFYPAPDLISLVFTISTYTGGAHPNTYFRTYVFDLTNETLLGLEDIFAVNPYATISPIVQASLIAQMADFADPQWIADGTGETPENYLNFVLDKGELVFLFPPYQVAAYAAGPQSVRIPLSDLANILNPRFLPQN